MAESIVLNLAARYAAAFGAMAINRQINQAVISHDENKYEVTFFDDFDNAFEEMTFEYEGEKLHFANMLLGDGSSIYAPPLLINFTREKQLIETDVSGSDNVVVERWGTRPYKLDIRGILVDVSGRTYPHEKITQLHRFFEYNGVVKVVGDQFYDKDIDSVYFKSMSIRPVEGFQDTMRFQLTAQSIKEVNYSLINPDE
jgi:hypothetical protein